MEGTPVSATVRGGALEGEVVGGAADRGALTFFRIPPLSGASQGSGGLTRQLQAHRQGSFV